MPVGHAREHRRIRHLALGHLCQGLAERDDIVAAMFGDFNNRGPEGPRAHRDRTA